MLVDATYISAFLIGLLGGVHCVGMCGGIVGALTISLPHAVRLKTRLQSPYLIAYNAGRIASYTAAGMLVGGFGGLVVSLGNVHLMRRMFELLAGLFMILLGLYLADWWRGLSLLERVGGHVWQYLEPLGRRLLPVRNPGQALLLGLVWGWLPCGLVYSVLIWSMAAGNWWEGGMLMLSFGVGTLPNLLLMGVFAARAAALVRNTWTRRTAGGFVTLFGLYFIVMASRSLSADAG
jgi:sulfite exporter TauE/SafE